MTRCLALHGWGQNSRLFRSKTSNLAKKLRKLNIELVFAEGPHSIPLTDSSAGNPNARAWFHTDGTDHRINHNRFDRNLHLHGWRDSVASLSSSMTSNGCTGVLGFSQGSTMAHILCELAGRGEEPWKSSLKFAVLVGGLDLSCEEFPPSAPGSPALSTPTLHVSGRADTSNPPCRQRECFSRFAREKAEWHEFEGGHVVPQNAEFAARFGAFLSSKVGADVSPRGGRRGSVKKGVDAGRLSLGRMLVRVLRHDVKKAGLGKLLRADGFVPLGALLELEMFEGVKEGQVLEVLQKCEKQRMALGKLPEGGGMEVLDHKRLELLPPGRLHLRANQGHTLKGVLDDELLLAPITHREASESSLFPVHGTYLVKWPLIKSSGGLSKMKRNHIHLAAGPPSQEEGSQPALSGIRRDCDLLVSVNAALAISAGVPFFRSANGVVLTPGDERGVLSAEFFRSVVRRDGGRFVE